MDTAFGAAGESRDPRWGFVTLLYNLCQRLKHACEAVSKPAHAIARVVYKMLKYKVEYDPLSVNEYQKQYDAQQVKYMKKKAARLGYELVPA
jgi:hypothetical protein